MTTEEIFSYIVDTIHTTVIATVDENGLPATCAIDMMDTDGKALYFLTAQGKRLYKRLKDGGYLALTGMHGTSTMTSVSVSLQGAVREIGREMLPALFEKNPYMHEIYPTEASRKALTVFAIYEGQGELFDLSSRPIRRQRFSFGNREVTMHGYQILDNCIGCGDCVSVCPQDCIDADSIPYRIVQANCLHCGNCLEACRYNAVQVRSIPAPMG